MITPNEVFKALKVALPNAEVWSQSEYRRRAFNNKPENEEPFYRAVRVMPQRKQDDYVSVGTPFREFRYGREDETAYKAEMAVNAAPVVAALRAAGYTVVQHCTNLFKVRKEA